MLYNDILHLSPLPFEGFSPTDSFLPDRPLGGGEDSGANLFLIKTASNRGKREAKASVKNIRL